MAESELSIRPLSSIAEAEACAHLMASSEPWLTLGRSYADSLAFLVDESRERYVAQCDGALAGFLIVLTHGALLGYIQGICVAPAARRKGIGTQLIRFAEQRIFTHYPNVFLCVSSFNTTARALYERLGYCAVGEFVDYFVEGHSEILLRKTRGPISTQQTSNRPEKDIDAVPSVTVTIQSVDR